MEQLEFYFGPEWYKPIQRFSSQQLIEIQKPVEESKIEKLTLREQFLTYHQLWQRFHFAEEHIEQRNFKFRTHIDIARDTLIEMFPNLENYIKKELSEAQIDLLYVTFETFLDQYPNNHK